MFHLDEKDAEEWSYKGEGGANVILQYCGTSPDFIGKVLRLQKVSLKSLNDRGSNKDSPILSTTEQDIWEDLQEAASAKSKEILAQAYINYIVGPLLGFEYVDPGIIISVSKGFLDAVEQNIDDKRPAWRSDSSKINHDVDFALLMSDHSLMPRSPSALAPCISIEIKPKCGVLPTSKYISEENYFKKHVSRFTMHQHLKLFQKKICCVSQYSPLDLFSESRERIQGAIEGLFETPQNNLRIFFNGSLVVGKLGGYCDQGLCNGGNDNSLFQKLEDILEGIILGRREERVACLKDLITETLLMSQILSRLLHLQKMDRHDIEGTIHAYYDIMQQPCPLCNRAINDANRSDQLRQSENDSGDVHNHEQGVSKCFQDENVENHVEKHTNGNVSQYDPSLSRCLHSHTIEQSRRIIRNYLLAASAKDCSLMLTFQPLPQYVTDTSTSDGSSIINLSSTKQSFLYKATVIDLDIKPLGKIIDYYELDQEIVKNYRRTLESL
eukprot:TRINITY_DN6898_c0_g1_i1.p1 TRINITY_DN6898_c0_g1~~TRINITY_DN6898_c0_g1_i1.p1  ORF type:complete len:497 (+),score=87.95 TRINITY_DN6898_c0_g1_i1:124-1614(+)